MKDNRPPIEIHVEVDETDDPDHDEIHIHGRISFLMLGLLGLLVVLVCSGLLLVVTGVVR